jgi:hypothetical protein
VKKLLLVLCLTAFTGVLLLPAAASASTPTLRQLARTVATLQKKVKAQAATISSQSSTIAALSSKVAADEATIGGQGSSITALQNSNVMALNAYLSVTAAGGSGAINGVTGPNIVFKGANVQVMSAVSESDTSGTGNLIVGWNDAPSGAPAGYRSGSNNLVCGDDQTFTSYGCFLAGSYNTASGSLTSINGGLNNTASTPQAVVSGGANNVASGWLSVVSGGNSNHATGMNSAVSGGMANYATNDSSTVSAGHNITNSLQWGWGHP